MFINQFVFIPDKGKKFNFCEWKQMGRIKEEVPPLPAGQFPCINLHKPLIHRGPLIFAPNIFYKKNI